MIVVLSVLTASNYLVYWFYPTCTPPDALVKCLSSFLLLIVGFINLISAVWTNRLHQICNYFKIGTKRWLNFFFVLQIFLWYLFSFIIDCYRCRYLSNDSWSNRKFCWTIWRFNIWKTSKCTLCWFISLCWMVKKTFKKIQFSKLIIFKGII